MNPLLRQDKILISGVNLSQLITPKLKVKNNKNLIKFSIEVVKLKPFRYFRIYTKTTII